MFIPAYIDLRIRRSMPAGCSIVPNSTPVISFGNCLTAKVATLGLNPSRKEFLDDRGQLLFGSERRLATLPSLKVTSLDNATAEAVEVVLKECFDYFHRRPYSAWFNYFAPILKCCGVSFEDGTACHLDLVQWATDPTWARLQPAVRQELLDADAEFLAQQLQNENIRLLLVNGSGTLRQLLQVFKLDLKQVDTIPARVPCRLFEGMLFERIRVIGWSTNLQSSFGVTSTLRMELAKRACAMVHAKS